MIGYMLVEDLRISRDEESVIAFDLRRGKFYSFTSVGGEVFSGLSERRTVSEIVDKLQAIYGRPRADLESDVVAFIERLVACGLCTHVPE